MIYINLSLVLLACILYYLAYISPRTDLLLFSLSSILFLFAGFSGVYGFSDVEIGSNTVATYNTTTNQVIAYGVPVYSKNPIFNLYLPLIEILLGIGLFVSFVIDLNSPRSVPLEKRF